MHLLFGGGWIVLFVRSRLRLGFGRGGVWISLVVVLRRRKEGVEYRVYRWGGDVAVRDRVDGQRHRKQ